MNVLSLGLSLSFFLAVIFTLDDWTPKHGIVTFVRRTLISGSKIFVLCVIALAVLLVTNKGI